VLDVPLAAALSVEAEAQSRRPPQTANESPAHQSAWDADHAVRQAGAVDDPAQYPVPAVEDLAAAAGRWACLAPACHGHRSVWRPVRTPAAPGIPDGVPSAARLGAAEAQSDVLLFPALPLQDGRHHGAEQAEPDGQQEYLDPALAV